MQNKILLITTGEIGMRHQALGLANALGGSIYERKVSLNDFWRKFPGHWVPHKVLDIPGLEEDTSIIISCGRRSTPFSLAFKKRNPDIFTVHIQNPQIPLCYFDLVVPMQHDNCKGDNVFVVETALHHLTKNDLAKSLENFDYKKTKKTIAIILGGNTKDFTFTRDNLNEILDIRKTLKNKQYNILLSTARRTPEWVINELKALGENGQDWFYFGKGENPYKFFLAQADGFIMTSDSVSMVSEALFTSKPVYLIDLTGKNKRLEYFKRNLFNKGFARPWQGAFEDYSYGELDSKVAVAEKIKELLSIRQGL